MEIVDILSLLVPNVWTAITQLCATAVLFFLMYKLAWKPVSGILEKRSEYEQSRLEEAEALKNENERLNKEIEEKYEAADKEASQIVAQAIEKGEAARNELLEEGKRTNQELLDKSKRELELERDKMMDSVHDDIVDAAVAVAEKMLQSKIDADSERDSIDAFVKEVIKE